MCRCQLQLTPQMMVPMQGEGRLQCSAAAPAVPGLDSVPPLPYFHLRLHVRKGQTHLAMETLGQTEVNSAAQPSARLPAPCISAPHQVPFIHPWETVLLARSLALSPSLLSFERELRSRVSRTAARLIPSSALSIPK